MSQAVHKALPAVSLPAPIHIERTRDPSHGDFASNIAMVLAGQAGQPPRAVADAIVAALGDDPRLARVEIAGPGFINFFLSAAAHRGVVAEILDAAEAYGRSDVGRGERVMVEFVSANPTGPLHVGHGRGAAYGDCVARLLSAVGYEVRREYYVNDAGRQMDILALSLWLRYLQAEGQSLPFPDKAYRGDYVGEAAGRLRATHGDAFAQSAADLYQDIDPADGDTAVDALIKRMHQLLGEQACRRMLDFILGEQLGEIEGDLTAFGVHYDRWFSERGLVDSGAIKQALEQLDDAGYLYTDAGAKWFASTRFGDEKDRVVIRANGTHTYFAADIAYHLDKLERGFAQLIDIWGADHHGYVPRVRAAVAALTGGDDRLTVGLVQFANLYRGREKLAMSTRAGQYVTLRALCDEVGMDAARYFYIMRSADQHLDFDLELAKSATNENPVYYIQYAHARVCSVERQAEQKGIEIAVEGADYALLDAEHEQRLMTTLSRYPEVVANAAGNYAPHTLAHYLRELADAFHSYYNAHEFLVDDRALRQARLALVFATRRVIANGLGLLGVSAPQEM